MSLTINIAGDMSFSHFEEDTITFSNEILDLLKEGDFNVCNLENPVCLPEERNKQKPIVLRSSIIPKLIMENFSAFSLANNHSMDYLHTGLEQTIQYLKTNGKIHFGAGENLSSAKKPVVLDYNNVRLAIWGITRFENASNGKHGTAKDSIKLYVDAIKEYKREGYFVVFYAHWGREYIDYPTPDDKKLARQLIDVGVDCIVGTHPHVAQGVEIYRNKYIFYSLGNFVFSSKVMDSVAFNKNDKRIEYGYILRIIINENSTHRVAVFPYQTVNGNLVLLSGDSLKSYSKHIIDISYETYSNDLHYQKFYESAASIRQQSSRMIRKQAKQHGLKSLSESAKNARLQDIRILLYPSLESKFTALSGQGFLGKTYRLFIHKFVSFSLIGLLLSLSSIAILGFLLGILRLPVFPTWWIVYLLSITASLLLNSRFVFDSKLSMGLVLKFVLCYLSSMLLGTMIIGFTRSNTNLPNWVLGYIALPFTMLYNFTLLNRILYNGASRETMIDENAYKDQISELIQIIAK